jgi:hypothetical protein
VFHRSSITNRLVAFCGVWLTFASCMQRTHAFCELYGCSTSGKQQVSGDCCETIAANDKCPHKHRCKSKPAKNVEAAKNAKDHQPTAPCDERCWCCQAPLPQQAPAPIDAESVTQPLVLSNGSIFTSTLLNVVPAGWAPTANESLPQRAIDICARLCRFLA